MRLEACGGSHTRPGGLVRSPPYTEKRAESRDTKIYEKGTCKRRKLETKQVEYLKYNKSTLRLAIKSPWLWLEKSLQICSWGCFANAPLWSHSLSRSRRMARLPRSICLTQIELDFERDFEREREILRERERERMK